VVAVVVSHNGSRWLPRTLASLAEQSHPVDWVVGVDTGSDDGSADLLRADLGENHVVTAHRRTGFGAAVQLGLQHADAARAERADWVWLLHDDAAAAPTALAHLLDAAALSPAVGVVGPKLVDWDDPSRLLEAGITVTRGGRRSTGIQPGERDQGQHDHRTDVLAVGTAGMLVSRDLWDRLGGLDPRLPLLRDDVDLCWRCAPGRTTGGARSACSRGGCPGGKPWSAAGRRGTRRTAAAGPPGRPARGAGPVLVAGAAADLCLAGGRWTAAVDGPARRGVARAWPAGRGVVRRGYHEALATLTVALIPWSWLGSRWRGRRAGL
jgi:hypothetical protein